MKNILDIIHDMESYYNKKLPPSDIKRYCTRIKHVPVEVLADIVADIMDSTSPTPSKFPTVKTILEKWAIWKTEHPDRLIQRQRTPCDACGGSGWLHFYIRLEWFPYPYRYCAGCGHCTNHLLEYPACGDRCRTRMEIEAIEGFSGWQ